MSVPYLLPETSLWANRKCLLICCIVSLANLAYGMDFSVIGSLQAMPGFLRVFGYPDPEESGGYAIGATFQQLITSLVTLGSFVSSILAGIFSHYFGRKVGLWIACLFTVIGLVLQIVTESKDVVYVGRLFIGFANGFFNVFAMMYTAEAAPAHLRSILVALYSEMITVGSVISAAMTNATQVRFDKSSYQIPMGVSFIIPLFLAVGLFFVPESPRYLVARGRFEEARKSLETLRGNSLQPEEFELEWVQMVRGIEEEKRIQETVGPLEIYKGTNLRRTLLCYGMAAANVAGGGTFVASYATYFMLVNGLPVSKTFMWFIINTSLGFVSVNSGMYAMRHLCGRRTILMIGAVAGALCMLGLAVPSSVAGSSETTRLNTLAAFTCLYLFFNSGTSNLATYPVSTELVNTRLRAYTFGTAQALTGVLSWLVAFCSPYFINPEYMNWGTKYGYIWAGSNVVALGFYFFFVPELKGRTLEEIDELFEKRVPTWDFKSFQTTILVEAHNQIQEENKFTVEKGDTVVSERGIVVTSV